MSTVSLDKTEKNQEVWNGLTVLPLSWHRSHPQTFSSFLNTTIISPPTGEAQPRIKTSYRHKAGLCTLQKRCNATSRVSSNQTRARDKTEVRNTWNRKGDVIKIQFSRNRPLFWSSWAAHWSKWEYWSCSPPPNHPLQLVVRDRTQGEFFGLQQNHDTFIAQRRGKGATKSTALCLYSATWVSHPVIVQDQKTSPTFSLVEKPSLGQL